MQKQSGEKAATGQGRWGGHGGSKRLVLSQLHLSELMGQLQRLLQAVRVLPSSLSRHVLAAPFAIQEGAELLNPLAGLQATAGHFLERGRGRLGVPTAPQHRKHSESSRLPAGPDTGR